MDDIGPTSMTPPALEDAVVQSLKKHPARWIFVRREPFPTSKDALKEYRSFVSTQYHLVKQVPSGDFWERIETPHTPVSSDRTPPLFSA